MLQASNKLNELHEYFNNISIKLYNEIPIKINKLQSNHSGSSKEYFRLYYSKMKSVIAVFNHDIYSNIQYVKVSKLLSKLNILIPNIFYFSKDKTIYLIEDLNDITLYDHIKSEVDIDIESVYKNIIDNIIIMQSNFKSLCSDDKNKDYIKEVLPNSIDLYFILNDILYFKNFFIKYNHISIRSELLDNDFKHLSQILSKYNSKSIVLRDLQSANIIINNKSYYFIDFQDCLIGSEYYDIGSLLFDSKININIELTNKLIKYYLSKSNLGTYSNLSENVSNRDIFFYFVLFRILQVTGAYSYLGLHKKIPKFINQFTNLFSNIRKLLYFIKDDIKFKNIKLFLESMSSQSILLQDQNNFNLQISLNMLSISSIGKIDKNINYMENKYFYIDYKTIMKSNESNLYSILSSNILINNIESIILYCMSKSLKDIIIYIVNTENITSDLFLKLKNDINRYLSLRYNNITILI